MAKEFIVIKNGTHVEARVDSKQEAEALGQELRDQNPRATYEAGKLDKKYYTTIGEAPATPVDEAL